MRIASIAWAVVVSMALAVGFAPRSFAQGAQGITPAGEYREGLPMGGMDGLSKHLLWCDLQRQH